MTADQAVVGALMVELDQAPTAELVTALTVLYLHEARQGLLMRAAVTGRALSAHKVVAIDGPVGSHHQVSRSSGPQQVVPLCIGQGRVTRVAGDCQVGTGQWIAALLVRRQAENCREEAIQVMASIAGVALDPIVELTQVLIRVAIRT